MPPTGNHSRVTVAPMTRSMGTYQRPGTAAPAPIRVRAAGWGEVGRTRPETQNRGGPRWAAPVVYVDLLVETATEPVFHPTGEGTAGSLGTLLSLLSHLVGGPSVAAAGHTWAGD